jgi:hypothetical protein
LKNLRKNNTNQEITSSHVDRFLAPKTSPKGTPKRVKNEPKNNTITYASENPTFQRVTSEKKNGKEERHTNGKV